MGGVVPGRKRFGDSDAGGTMNGRQLCRRALVLLFAVVFLAGGSLFAGVTASISGTVKDSSGASIAGAKVTATNVGTAISVSQPTNGQGYYSFQSLPLGTYTIEVEQAGFKTYRQSGFAGGCDPPGRPKDRACRRRRGRTARRIGNLANGRGHRRQRNDRRPACQPQLH